MEQNSPLRCDNVADTRVTGEGSLAIVAISEEMVYVVTVVEMAAVEVAVLEVASVMAVAAVVVAAMVAAPVVVAAVVVTATGVESTLKVVVVVVKDSPKSMSSLSTAAMSLIDVHVMSVVGGWV